MLKVPLTYWKFPVNIPAGANEVEAARKSGDVAKGERVRITGVRRDGKISVDRANGQASEHWHSLDSFYGNVPGHEGKGANDNARQ